MFIIPFSGVKQGRTTPQFQFCVFANNTVGWSAIWKSMLKTISMHNLCTFFCSLPLVRVCGSLSYRFERNKNTIEKKLYQPVLTASKLDLNCTSTYHYHSNSIQSCYDIFSIIIDMACKWNQIFHILNFTDMPALCQSWYWHMYRDYFRTNKKLCIL